MIAVTTEGEEVLLQHEFIVGNVTSCLVSLGQLYQGGWTIFKDETNDSLIFFSVQRLHGFRQVVTHIQPQQKR